MTDDTNDVPRPRWDSKRRKVIHTTCAPHRGPVGFTTLALSKRDGQIELDPHTAGARKVTLNEDGARVLRGALTVWLR
ncbi:MAG: hypothetical protein ACRDRW_15400 [Pseudonocardiaceae bacterium]